MLSWDEYIDSLLKESTVLDKVDISTNDGVAAVSPIIKASIQMLENMIETEGHHNVLVFPEIKRLSLEFVLCKLLFNIHIDKIKKSYNPHEFIPGENLKFLDCTVQFIGIETGNHSEYISFNVSDGDSPLKKLVPIENAPFFQKTESKRLSNNKSYIKAYKAFKDDISSQNNSVISNLKKHKTHLGGSIFYVTNVNHAINELSEIYMSGSKISDIFYIGKANKFGDISNAFPGKLSGNPAIIIAPDLYSVQNAVEKGVNVQSIIINLLHHNILEGQLSNLDEISNNSFPILCLTDIKNSFDLDILKNRRYNIWRWNSENIIESIFSSGVMLSEQKIRNCARQKIFYENMNCPEIDKALQLLYLYKSESENQQFGIINIYTKLFNLLFKALRVTIPFNQEEINNNRTILMECRINLDQEKRFVNQDLYNDFIRIIENLEKFFVADFKNPKISKIEEIIASQKYSSICIVIADKSEKSKYEKYWNNYAAEISNPPTIKIVFPQEYTSLDLSTYEATCVVGWLNNKKMRDIIYSFCSENYIILTYSGEAKWQKIHTQGWNKALSNSNNHAIIKNSFSKKVCMEIENSVSGDGDVVYGEPISDELADIEGLIISNTYRRYGVSSDNHVTETYPVSFVGGYLSFYGIGHKIITVTDIISGKSEKITFKVPEELKVGDFVAIRESDRDIIKEIADKILEKSGKKDLRKKALIWKESLELETRFSTIEEIFEKLEKYGCSCGYQTVKNWIENEEQFSLQDIEDLLCIAKALDDRVLLESYKEVFEAGNEVKRAHKLAGKILSQRLRTQLAEKINEFGKIDIYNFWEPIKIYIEEVGTVIILKVIDINIQTVPIAIGNINKLLSD